MGFNIESMQNRDMYYTALAVDGNTKRLKEDGYDDDEIADLISGVNCKGNANGEIDTAEEIEAFKYEIETLITKKEATYAEETNFARETSKYYSQVGGLLGIGVGLIGALATKGKFKLHPLLGMLGGGILGFGVGNVIGSNKADKIINKTPDVADLQEEIKELKEEYRKFEASYM